MTRTADRGGKPATYHMRAARPGDVPSLAAIAKEAYALYWPRMDRTPAPVLADYGALVAAGEVTVLEADGEVAGFIVMRPEPSQEQGAGLALHVENLAVAPDFQGRGYGAVLMEQSDKAARQCGASTIELYTNISMTENIAFYGKLGFAEVGRRRQDGYDRIFFSKGVG